MSLQSIGPYCGRDDVYKRRDDFGTFYYARVLGGIETYENKKWWPLSLHQAETIGDEIVRCWSEQGDAVPEVTSCVS